MARIFLSAGHSRREPGAIALGTTEAQEMIQTRDLIAEELQRLGQDYLCVPDTLSLTQTLDWINERGTPKDVALEIHGNAFNGEARGSEAFYICNNETRRDQAQLILKSLLEAVPQLRDRGVRPDTYYGGGRLAFCRDIILPSVLLELCFIDNQQDLQLLQNQRKQFAKGMANGLVAWVKQVEASEDSSPIKVQAEINIRIKDRTYDDKGILIQHNSYIPMNLVENLGVTKDQIGNCRQVNYANVVYLKAVKLQEFDIEVDWESKTNTLVLTPSPVTDNLGQIMGIGKATEGQLRNFLEKNNPEALQEFPDLPKLYIEQAGLEGINSDVAFCQMCLETAYLRFGGIIKPEQNNFCGLGAVGGGVAGASFDDHQTGVKAHIQHLKAYASRNSINNQPIVDPRFKLVPRGVADTVEDLTGRWSADDRYGEKILGIIRSLHKII